MLVENYSVLYIISDTYIYFINNQHIYYVLFLLYIINV